MAEELEFTTGDGLVRYATQLVLEQGHEHAPRGMKTRELSLPVVLTLNDVYRPFMSSTVRRANYRFGLAEAAWMLSGSNDAKLIGSFNKQMLKFSDDGDRLWGAYGPRLMGQIDHVLSTLSRDRDSRQAIITTWRPQVGPLSVGMINQVTGRPDLNEGRMLAAGAQWEGDGLASWDGHSWRSKDTPCTVAWHFQIRDDKLNLTVFMRSNDVWLGLPYDLVSFTSVQRVIASALNVEPGKYHHVVSNLHIYEQHYDKADKMLATDGIRSPVSLPRNDCTFRGAMSSLISRSFDLVMKNDIVSCDSMLNPFVAAIDRNSALWPDVDELMTSNGRLLHPKQK
jgi:thymidylate synthase